MNNVTPPANAPALSAGTQMIVMLLVTILAESEHNPRKIFNLKQLIDFGNELKQHGVKQPLRVMPLKDGKHIVVSGARRLRAARAVGIETLPCIVLGKELTPAEFVVDQLLDNMANESLTIVERAEAYQKLLKETGWNQSKLAQHLGCAESTISKSMAVKSSLLDELRQHVLSGAIQASLAYALATIPEREEQLRIGRAVVEGKMSEVEAKAVIAQLKKPKRKVDRTTATFELTTFDALRTKLTEMLSQVGKMEKSGLQPSALKQLWGKS